MGYGDTELVQALLDNQLLKERLANQTQYMQLFTHQLATPLTSLSGSVDLLAESRLLPEQREEFLHVIQHQVQRLKNLLAELETLRNLENGVLEPTITQLCLAELVREVVQAFLPYPIHCHFNPDLPVVWGDRWQISQVLINLISNGIKYTPDGSPLDIHFALLSTGWVEVSVQDRGLGIPAADQPHLFERFYRVKHHDRAHIEGTGLGLSLCKLLIEKQGGQMGFQSTYGEGSRFYFTLPTTPAVDR
jgi:signal transduction histidine kinase